MSWDSTARPSHLQTWLTRLLCAGKLVISRILTRMEYVGPPQRIGNNSALFPQPPFIENAILNNHGCECARIDFFYLHMIVTSPADRSDKGAKLSRMSLHSTQLRAAFLAAYRLSGCWVASINTLYRPEVYAGPVAIEKRMLQMLAPDFPLKLHHELKSQGTGAQDRAKPSSWACDLRPASTSLRAMHCAFCE